MRWTSLTLLVSLSLLLLTVISPITQSTTDNHVLGGSTVIGILKILPDSNSDELVYDPTYLIGKDSYNE